MRHVAIIGTGQTKHSAKRRDFNLAEMVEQAVFRALEDANLSMKDVDALVVGNMQGFGGVAQPEQWIGDWIGGYQKPVLRIATGGTTGGSVGQGAYYACASGMYDVVLGVAWEKHSDSAEPGATTGLAHTGIANLFHAIKYGIDMKSLLATSAVGAAAGVAVYQAIYYMHRSGCTIHHLDEVAAKARRNGAKNKYAHLQVPGCTAADIAKTDFIAYPFRYGHICPASDGASAIVVAKDDIARKKCERPAWVNGAASVSDEENQLQSENYGGVGVLDPSEQMGCRMSAMKAYAQAGINNPREEIDIAEIYQPFPSQELIFAEKLMLLDEGKAWQALENNDTDINGKIPCTPSGGVNCTNAIGSSALQRILEGALQIMGKAEEHQVPKKVRNVVCHGWGGNTNLITVTVLGDEPRRRFQ